MKPGHETVSWPLPWLTKDKGGALVEAGSKTVIWLSAWNPDHETVICDVPIEESAQYSELDTETTLGWEEVTAVGIVVTKRKELEPSLYVARNWGVLMTEPTDRAMLEGIT